METMKTVNIVIAAGAIVFVGSVWEWQGTTAAWAAAGLCTLLVGLTYSVMSTLDDLQHALKGLRE